MKYELTIKKSELNILFKAQWLNKAGSRFLVYISINIYSVDVVICSQNFTGCNNRIILFNLE
jgi:hypothetical protein